MTSVAYLSQPTIGSISSARSLRLLQPCHANPLDDIGNVADRAGVMVRGRWFSEGYIQGRLDEIARRFAAD